jgi:hypothetical protein
MGEKKLVEHLQDQFQYRKHPKAGSQPAAIRKIYMMMSKERKKPEVSGSR